MDNVKALEVIRSLADGIDPFTGEIFSEDNIYQSADTIRALSRAVIALEYIVKQRERKNNLPERAGKPWDEEETETLLKQYDEGFSFSQIAKEHQRTRGAIEAQLAKMGKIPFNESRFCGKQQI